MISGAAELREANAILKEVKDSLKREKIPFDEKIETGVMIEVPSAAVLAKEFAEEVDFLSIGTNDLIQYLLAVDRGNDIVASSYQEFHPAVVRTLKHIITEGKKSGAEVSLCGEMAADILAVPLLVGLGLDSISVSASAIPHAKKIIRSIAEKLGFASDFYEETIQNLLANKYIDEGPIKFSDIKIESEINTRLKNFFDLHLNSETKNLF